MPRPPNPKPPQLYSCGGFVILVIVERYCFIRNLLGLAMTYSPTS
jgi:hypothetical protein